MEQFLIDNTALFESLVDKFTAEDVVGKHGSSSASPNPDIVVCTRIRPLLEEELSSGFRASIFPRTSEVGVVDLHELYNSVRGPTLRSSKFQVDRAFGIEATTEQIYEDVAKDLVPFAWNGGIGTLFAYGQTGSGKTFTVSRLEQLVIESLMSGTLQGPRKIYITVIELAGNAAFDLLNARKSVSVLEDSFGVTQIAGAIEHLATTREEVAGLVEAANSLRRTASTEKNDQSSRSHAICRIRIENPDVPSAEDGILYLIDLAGSEAARDRVKHGADRMRETLQINKSLSVLKDCIRGKSESDAVVMSGQDLKSRKRKPHVPFRQSALTKLLKHVFDPASQRACKTVVVACVNPSNADYTPSKNTLRYAEMLRVLVPVTKKALYKFDVPMTWSNNQLKDWIDKNSGDPPISSSTLAPSESGAQLLRLPDPEFESRCLKTPGVTAEQARAFRLKLWKMHIDSQNAKESPTAQKNVAESEDPDTILGHLNLSSRTSSHDPDYPKSAAVPFKDRIRPGMVVSWTPKQWVPATGELSMVVILSPASAVGSHVRDFQGKSVSAASRGDWDGTGEDSSQQQYLCAVVAPGVLAEAYEINIWRQVVVDVTAMDQEVILEYDAATRYYYITI